VCVYIYLNAIKTDEKKDKYDIHWEGKRKQRTGREGDSQEAVHGEEEEGGARETERDGHKHCQGRPRRGVLDYERGYYTLHSFGRVGK